MPGAYAGVAVTMYGFVKVCNVNFLACAYVAPYVDILVWRTMRAVTTATVVYADEWSADDRD